VQSGENLAQHFVDEYQERQIILSGIAMIERMCDDALVWAENIIEALNWWGSG
jgi:hypothetical protein